MLPVEGEVRVQVRRDEVDVFVTRHDVIKHGGRGEQHVARDTCRVGLCCSHEARHGGGWRTVLLQDRSDQTANELPRHDCVARVLKTGSVSQPLPHLEATKECQDD